MSKVNSYQKSLLYDLQDTLERALPVNDDQQERNRQTLILLEQVSSLIGGFDIKAYHNLINEKELEYDFQAAQNIANKILASTLPASVLLGILATEKLNEISQKNKGVYYTDYRLAEKMADMLLVKFKTLIETGNDAPKLIDPSCGSGILLCAFLEKAKHIQPVEQLITHTIHGSDISTHAVRATILSISSLTSDLAAISYLSKHFAVADSLIAKSQLFEMVGSQKFDMIIGNPPWEKLKLTRHEYEVAQGTTRHYGMEFKKLSKKKSIEFEEKKANLKKYATDVDEFDLETRGEKDLYVAFLKLGLKLLGTGGEMIQLVPASFIRNQQTAQLRKTLIACCSELNITLFDNKARYFEIDSRFKFIMIQLKKGTGLQKIEFSINDIKLGKAQVHIDINKLQTIRPDFSIPEIQNENDWQLFYKISSTFPHFGKNESMWNHSFCREIDMTLDKSLFVKNHTKKKVIPVIEGRMIHQYATGVKAYVSGTGRQALWEQSIFNNVNDLRPQFFVEPANLNKVQLLNSQKWRVGFCDITGQTNERTMLCAYVPPGTICGNKVPTIEFTYEEQFEGLSLLWLGIANSFVYDWLIRKVITTNANFFIVDSIPVPNVELGDSRCTKIIDIVKKIIFECRMNFNWETAELRAEVEVLVASLYKLNLSDLKTILGDFPIVDKQQPSVAKERGSSVTRDLIISKFLTINNDISRESDDLGQRLLFYKNAKSVPFLPSQFKSQNLPCPHLNPVIQ
jgi:Alw26I/Eco31I/Esp3I family type II restriction m6 adenine DNA methyltransferase